MELSLTELGPRFLTGLTHGTLKPMSECPTPSKDRLDLDGAIHRAISLSRRMGVGIRYYECPCGAYHLTRWSRYTSRPERRPYDHADDQEHQEPHRRPEG